MKLGWYYCLRLAVAAFLCAALPIPSVAQPLIYVASESSLTPTLKAARLTVINSASGHAVKMLELGEWTPWPGTPYSNPAVVAAPNGLKVYVTVGADLVVVDAKSYAVQRLTLGGSLGELAISADGSRLYVASHSHRRVLVVDTALLQPIGPAIPMPEQPRGLAVTASGAQLYVLGPDVVYVADTVVREITATLPTRPAALEMVLHPDGSRLYIGNSTASTVSADGNSVTAYDTTTLTEIQTLVLPDFRLFIGASIGAIGSMAILPSGTRLYVPLTSSGFRTLPAAFFRREIVHVVDASTLEILDTVEAVQSNPTFTSGIAAVAAPDGAQVFIGAPEGLTAIDAATSTVAATGDGVSEGDSLAIAPAPPCWFEPGPQQSFVRGQGGTITVDVPAPAGCAWEVSGAGDWIVPSATSGNGPARITLGLGASDVPRSGTVEIANQILRIDQLVSRIVIEGPVNGSDVTLPFDISGWTIEQRAEPQMSGSGIERVQIYDYPPVGPPVFLGLSRADAPRADIASSFGERYRNAGFSKRIARLAAGTHTLAVFSQSQNDSQFTSASVTVTIRRAPSLFLDTPANGTIVRQPFRVAGWAADTTVASGSGVDAVRVSAVRPDGSRIELGDAASGLHRPDVDAYFGQVSLAPGFAMNVSGLPAGPYTLVTEVRYTATGSFERSASVQIIVTGSEPFGAVDTPVAGTEVAGAVAITGWALSTDGVMRVSVYRDPAGGETQQVWIGDATFVEGARPDIASAFPDHPQNTRAGWGLSVLTNMLPRGGNGPITFHVYAFDTNNNVTRLGSPVVTGINAMSALPFGTIDTPGQGSTVSGTITVFGWALTPGPNIIPTDGSTIQVLIDDVAVGQPTFNQCRGTNGSMPATGTCNDDIATTFGSAYRNIAEGRGAIGSFELDTTTLSNGIHSIAWLVFDSAGNAAGIGSRYFYVYNGG